MTARMTPRLQSMACEHALSGSGGSAYTGGTLGTEARIASMLGEIFDNSPAVMAVFSGASLEITLVNRAWQRVAPAAAVVGRTLGDLLPEPRDRARRIIERVYATGRPVRVLEVPGAQRVRGAQPSWWNVMLQPFRNERGGVTDVLLQAMDVSEQVRYRLDLEESDAAKSRFIAALSHEVRTPLTAIVGYADMLAAELGGPLTSAQRHQVERVKASAWHTVAVLEQILTYSRASAGTLDLAPQPVDVSEAVRTAVDAAKRDAAEADVQFELELPRAGAHVVTDAGRLRQILHNLVSNAVRFTDGDSVRITCQLRTDGCTVTVADDGPGISTEKREQIFELFQRDGIQHSDAAGAGLGLPVSRQLARLLGGDLTLDSAPGRGTSFTLRLPVTNIPS